MNPRRLRKVIRGELGNLRRQSVINAETYDLLMAQYPADRWDWSALGKWFLVFGAIASAAGLLILGSTIFEFTLEKLAVGLGVVIAGSFYGARRLGVRDLLWSQRSLELLGGIALVGLTFTLGIIFSSGSGNWPALVLIDLLILLPVAYLLRNVLLLILSVLLFFTWFGGVTGYVSGWGAYFFGMNYPMRFLLASLVMIGLAALHRGAESGWLRRFEGFFKVWLSSGVFFAEMSLWLMSLFGNYGSIFQGHLETAAELLFFNVLWAAFNIVLLKAGTQWQLRMLRGYAITYLIIQAYTIYFWKIAGALGPVLATFVAGAATLGIVVHFESRRRLAQN